MRDHESGAVVRGDRVRHPLLCQVVQRGSRLIEDQDPGLGRQRPRDQEPLLLPAGDPSLALGDHGLHSHRHLSDILRDPRRFSRLPRVIQSEPRRGDRDIFKYTAHHQLAVLHDNADVAPQRSQVQAADVPAVVKYRTSSGLFKSQKDPDQGGFAAACLSDDRDIFPRLDPDAQVVQNIRHVVRIAEADMAQFNISAK